MSRKSKIDSEKKVEIVERVLTDEISLSEAARLTGVDMASIRSWRNLYLSDGPTALMAQPSNKVYSQELKLQAVCEYLDGKSTQADIVNKYHLRSSKQVRNWVKRYEKMGSAGLEDRRGRRAGTQPARTHEEEMRDRIAELERRNRELQMENDLLKKVRELEMKGRYL